MVFLKCTCQRSPVSTEWVDDTVIFLLGFSVDSSVEVFLSVGGILFFILLCYGGFCSCYQIEALVFPCVQFFWKETAVFAARNA